MRAGLLLARESATSPVGLRWFTHESLFRVELRVRTAHQVLRKQPNNGPDWLTGALGATRVGMAAAAILHATLGPGMSAPSECSGRSSITKATRDGYGSPSGASGSPTASPPTG